MHIRITASLALLATALCTGTQAQTIYRIVGADGKVTFSDKPPISADQGKIATTGVGAAAAASNSALPFEIRQAVSKFPVTLYTSADCAPCSEGRSLLTTRGIPFNERTVSTNEDVAALQRFSGQSSLPFLTIGGQKINGFSAEEWNQYLDVAGYSKTSQLPPTYRNPPASPMVAVQKPAVKQDDKAEAITAPTPTPAPTPGVSNPAGIKF